MSKQSPELLSYTAYWRTSVRETAGELRAMLGPKSIPSNVSAGITVALVALPLNLALAIACGLPPSVGLLTGAIAGILGAVLGASRFQITGPEVALAPITLSIVSRHGVEGLLLITFLAGLLQIGAGLLRVGRLVNAIPVPVVAGFMGAVGLLVLDSQLPRFLGLPEDVHRLSQLRSFDFLSGVNPWTIATGGLVLAVILGLPRLSRRAPAPLIALAVAVAATSTLGLDVATVGTFDARIPAPSLPDFGSMQLWTLLPEAVTLALLASVDSLLCAVSVDARTGKERTRNDQELVGQGIANLASACFGGMPVAAAVVRSVAAVETGATSRLAAIVQSVALGLVLLVLGSVVSVVPLVALAAILLVIGVRLIPFRQASTMWGIARSEAAILGVTAAGILAMDFVMGVALGVVLALARFAHQQRASLRRRSTLAPTSPFQDAAAASHAETSGDASFDVIRLEGPLFFGSQDRIADVVRAHEASERLVLDVSEVSAVDVSGALALARAIKPLASKGTRAWLRGARREADEVLTWAFDQCECPLPRIDSHPAHEEGTDHVSRLEAPPGGPVSWAARYAEVGSMESTSRR